MKINFEKLHGAGNDYIAIDGRGIDLDWGKLSLEMSRPHFGVYSDGIVVLKNSDIANTAIKNLIREDKIYQIPSLVQAGGKEGMQTLDMDLQRLLHQGKIERTDAIKVAENPELFEKGIF